MSDAMHPLDALMIQRALEPVVLRFKETAVVALLVTHPGFPERDFYLCSPPDDARNLPLLHDALRRTAMRAGHPFPEEPVAGQFDRLGLLLRHHRHHMRAHGIEPPRVAADAPHHPPGELAEAVPVEKTAAFRAGVEAALAAYVRHEREGRDWIAGSLWAKLDSEGRARVQKLLEGAQ